MRKVNKDSPLPLYYQLKEIISELIENEELQPNTPIPSERELCEYHGVSRMTVNKAIIHMVNEGLLYREQGKGTFVSKPKEKHLLSSLLGFTEDMKMMGLKVDTRILDFKKEIAGKAIQNQLKLKDQTEVFEIKRLRIVDDAPYAFETAYIPAFLCEGLSKEQLENRSLYDVLINAYGLAMSYADQTIEPVIADEYASEVLQLEKNSIALKFTQKTFMENHVPIEYTRAIYRSDKYKFEITLKA